MYSPLGLVIFVAVEGTCMFYKRSQSLFQILFVAAAYEQTNVISRARKAAVHRNAPARRRRTVPCDLSGASLPVPPLFSIMFLDTLCSKKWYDVPHVECVVFIRFSGLRFTALVDIRLVTINRHARCSL